MATRNYEPEPSPDPDYDYGFGVDPLEYEYDEFDHYTITIDAPRGGRSITVTIR